MSSWLRGVAPVKGGSHLLFCSNDFPERDVFFGFYTQRERKTDRQIYRETVKQRECVREREKRGQTHGDSLIISHFFPQRETDIDRHRQT